MWFPMTIFMIFGCLLSTTVGLPLFTFWVIFFGRMGKYPALSCENAHIWTIFKLSFWLLCPFFQEVQLANFLYFAGNTIIFIIMMQKNSAMQKKVFWTLGHLAAPHEILGVNSLVEIGLSWGGFWVLSSILCFFGFLSVNLFGF